MFIYSNSGSTGRNFEKVYAINPIINNSIIKVQSVAQTNALYKCSNYSFNNRTCQGDWIRIKKLNPGEEYLFYMYPFDPAFGEGSDVLVLKNITIDGSFSDWDAVISNPQNFVNDGIKGIDDLDSPQSANKDALEFAYTWNNDSFIYEIKPIFAYILSHIV